MKRLTALAVILGLVCTTAVHAQIAKTLTYQGVLKDAGGVRITGTVSLDLTIYDGATALYTDSHGSVSVDNGLFTVVIGTGTGGAIPLAFDKPYDLGVTVNAGTELVPRTPLTAEPYALNSCGVSIASGATAGYVLTSDASGNGSWQPAAAGGDTDWTETGGNVVRTTGNVGIGTATPGVNLDVVGNIRALSAGGTPILYLNNGVTQWQVKNDANNLSIGDGTERFRVESSGRARVTKDLLVVNGTSDPSVILDRTGGASWNIHHTAGNEVRFDFGATNRMRLNSGGSLVTDGGNLTVFRPSGDTQVALNQGGAEWTMRVPNATPDLSFSYLGTERVRIRDNGNVGIGANPGTKLDVVLQGTAIATPGAMARFVSATGAGGGNALISLQSGDVTGRSGLLFGDTTNDGAEGSIIYENGAGSANQHMVFNMFGHLMHFNRYGLAIKRGAPLTAASNALEVEGNASKTTAGDWLANSDRSIKTDIQDIENATDTIKRLRPVKFKYTEAYKAEHPSVVADRYYYNYVAQEFQEVFPESVQEDPHGILMMDGHSANIVAIKAIQELTEKLETVMAELEQLKAGN